MPTRLVGRSRSALRSFLHSEAMGGIVLIAAALAAMVVANLPATSEGYFHLLHMTTGPELSPKYGPMTLHLWINDALMAIFFMLVGLEIKRELIDGRLASWDRRRLPVAAAAAGMIVPALVYLAVVAPDPALTPGWAIPAATDIAFAIGVLALLGKQAPASLKLFLTTVAIVDDMGAVVVIAVVYTAGIGWGWLAASFGVLALMIVLNRRGVLSLWPYLLLTLPLWLFVFKSGVHATVAGVLAAMAIPIVKSPAAPDAIHSPLHRLEHMLHSPVAFVIVPLFGFANAGVSFAGLSPAILLEPLPLAIMLGLFAGKQIGIFSAVWISDKTGFAPCPRATWRQVWGVSMLAGIGFTMSLFIGGLAFPGNELLIDEVKIGVLVGSIISAAVGFLLLRTARPIADEPERIADAADHA
jgi:NhaA family Na+:H+ antiporter